MPGVDGGYVHAGLQARMALCSGEPGNSTDAPGLVRRLALTVRLLPEAPLPDLPYPLVLPLAAEPEALLTHPSAQVTCLIGVPLPGQE